MNNLVQVTFQKNYYSSPRPRNVVAVYKATFREELFEFKAIIEQNFEKYKT